jgi:DNA-binding MarR family transcriptional regulator
MPLSRKKPEPATTAPSQRSARQIVKKAARGSAGRNGKERPAIALGILDRRLGYHVRRLQVWIFRDFISTLSVLDLRPTQYSVLTVIAENPGLSQTDLFTTLGVERSRLVRLLDGLEQRRLVRRMRAPEDRRSHALQLTGEGAELLESAHELVNEHEARVTGRIGPDYDRLMTILRDSCEFTRLP